jgi:TctA family transporter
MVLGDKAEDAFRQSMLMSNGSLSIFWSNPLVTGIMVLGLLMLLWPVFANAVGVHNLRRRAARHSAKV